MKGAIITAFGVQWSGEVWTLLFKQGKLGYIYQFLVFVGN